jgi:hypothetical protein
MELELSTSPRATWVWAANRNQAESLRALLEADGCQVAAAHDGIAGDLTLDLDIGVVALEGLECLREAGYSFRWHSVQHPLDCAEDMYGIPVAGAARTEPA